MFVRCERDSRRDDGDDEGGGVVIVRGWKRRKSDDSDLNQLIQIAVESARRALYPTTTTTTPTGLNRSTERRHDLDGDDDEEEERELKDLTLCTWNALGPDFTASRVVDWLDRILSTEYTTEELIETLKRGGLMLDDGWQETDSFRGTLRGEPLKGLRGFGVRPGWYDFDDGEAKEEREIGWQLRDAVERIKAKGIERVGVWITITGYVSPFSRGATFLSRLRANLLG